MRSLPAIYGTGFKAEEQCKIVQHLAVEDDAGHPGLSSPKLATAEETEVPEVAEDGMEGTRKVVGLVDPSHDASNDGRQDAASPVIKHHLFNAGGREGPKQ